MKDFGKIKEDTRVQALLPYPNGFGGFLNLREGKKRTFSFFASKDKDKTTTWEHVSVSIANDRHKTPTWEEMCEVKSIFWRDDEEVHQIHPREAEYLHNVGDLDNVLHLWRPAQGGETER